jgi:hypothetical protein
VKRLLSLAALTALATLGVSSSAAFAAYKCHDTAQGQVCAGNTRTTSGADTNAGGFGTNRNGYFESGRGGGCGYHFEFNPGPEPDKYVGQC